MSTSLHVRRLAPSVIVGSFLVAGLMTMAPAVSLADDTAPPTSKEGEKSREKGDQGKNKPRDKSGQPKDKSGKGKDASGDKSGDQNGNRDARKGKSTGDDVLSGPKVRDDESEDDAKFGNSGKPGAKNAPQRPMIKQRQWMNAFKEIELTPEQSEKARAIQSEFEESRKSFEKEFGAQRRELEAKAREMGDESAGGKEIRQQMKAMQEKAPKPEPFQRRLFALLDDTQQEAMRGRLAEMEKRAAQEQEKRGNRPAGKPGQRDGMSDPKGDRKDDSMGDDQMKPDGPPRGKQGAGEAPRGKGSEGKPDGQKRDPNQKQRQSGKSGERGGPPAKDGSGSKAPPEGKPIF